MLHRKGGGGGGGGALVCSCVHLRSERLPLSLMGEILSNFSPVVLNAGRSFMIYFLKGSLRSSTREKRHNLEYKAAMLKAKMLLM